MRKNKKPMKHLFTSFTLGMVLSGCSTLSPDQLYSYEPYHEDPRISDAGYSFSDGRTPANFLNQCSVSIQQFFGAPKPTKVTKDLPYKPILRYPKGYKEPGMHIQYGFESEYLHEEAEVLLKSYMPDTAVFPHITKEKWLKLSHEERDQFLQNNEKAIFPYREKARLINIIDDPEMKDVMPESFVYDAGHYEVVLPPVDSAEELVYRIQKINNFLGTGSMQVMISNPYNKNGLSELANRAAFKDQTLGHYNFVNDLDTLSKLDQGYRRYLTDPNVQAAQSFNHPWLGPMTKLKHDQLKRIIDEMSLQKKYDDEELKKMSYIISSHKFIGGLAFRPDVAYKKTRLASEVRDCHRNLKCIEDRIKRETSILIQGKESFAAFKNLKAFDSENDFMKLDSTARSTLREIFPKYGSYNAVVTERFRNFAYPLRDWSEHAKLSNDPNFLQKIKSVQDEYVAFLNQQVARYNKREITKEEAQKLIMGELSAFPEKSGLMQLMKEKYQELITPQELKALEHLKLTFLLNQNRQTALAQVNPEPKAAEATNMPFLSTPAFRASSIPSGMVAAVVFP